MYLRAARADRPPLLLTLHSVMTRLFATSGASLAGLRTMLRGRPRHRGDEPGDRRRVGDRALDHGPHVGRPQRGDAADDAVVPLADDGDHLLCVGRLVPSKGFEQALIATRLLAAHRPSVRLTIAGDGPERERLERTAAELGVRERAEFLGEVRHDRVATLIDAATVVVMPSRFEGMPLVALEAAWMGRPVVASAAPGFDEVIVDGVTGRLVEGDDEALAAAIEDLLRERSRARTMGAAARVRAESAFSLAACVDRYEALYTELRTDRGRVGLR